MRTALRRCALLLSFTGAALAGAACGKDNPSGPAATAADTVAGTFALNKVNAVSLPATIASDPGNYTLQITAGSALLQPTGQFTFALTSKETVAGHASTYVDSTTGTWTQATGTITFAIPAAGSLTSATWDGTSLTLVEDGVTYVFRKH